MKKNIMKEVKIQGNLHEIIRSTSLNIFSNSSWFIYALFHPKGARNTFFKMLIFCSDLKMIPARNASNAHAQRALVNDEQLLPTGKFTR